MAAPLYAVALWRQGQGEPAARAGEDGVARHQADRLAAVLGAYADADGAARVAGRVQHLPIGGDRASSSGGRHRGPPARGGPGLGGA